MSTGIKYFYCELGKAPRECEIVWRDEKNNNCGIRFNCQFGADEVIPVPIHRIAEHHPLELEVRDLKKRLAAAVEFGSAMEDKVNAIRDIVIEDGELDGG